MVLASSSSFSVIRYAPQPSRAGPNNTLAPSHSRPGVGPGAQREQPLPRAGAAPETRPECFGGEWQLGCGDYKDWSTPSALVPSLSLLPSKSPVSLPTPYCLECYQPCIGAAYCHAWLPQTSHTDTRALERDLRSQSLTKEVCARPVISGLAIKSIPMRARYGGRLSWGGHDSLVIRCDKISGLTQPEQAMAVWCNHRDFHRHAGAQLCCAKLMRGDERWRIRGRD